MANDQSLPDAQRRLTTQGVDITNGEIRNLKLNHDGTISASATISGFPGFSKSTANTTTTPLAANASFVGTFEQVTAYSQITLVMFGRPSTFQGDASNGSGTLIFDFSNDGGVTIDVSVPSFIDDVGYFIPFPLIPVGTHFRVRYLNDGGAFLGFTNTPVTLTTFRLTTLLATLPTKELVRTLAQDIRLDQPVTLTRSVTMGANPAGKFTNVPTSGNVTVPAQTPLTAGGVYSTGFINLTGFESILLLIATDQVSGTNGIDIQFSDNGTTVRSHAFRTFAANDVTSGSKFTTLLIRANYVQVVYTNGGTNQGSFYLAIQALIQPFAVEDSIEATISASSNAEMVRDLPFAKDPAAGTYANITRAPIDAGSRTGLHVSMQSHVVPTPIAALTTWVTNQATIASTTVAVNVIPAPTAGRKTFAVKALSTNTKVVFVGPTSGVTSGSGWELAAGESVVVEIDTTTGVWVIGTTTAAQGLSFIEVS